MTGLRFLSVLAVGLCVYASHAVAHWPDQSPHKFADLGDFELEGGGKIKNLRISFVTHGKLNAARSNAVLVLHGFGLNHHQFDHLIGPGQPLDTNKYFIICPDALGNTQGTFEHSTSATNSGLKMRFPPYNSRDVIRANYRLVTESVGIPRLLAITGISLGADQAIQFAVSFPDFMDGIFPISGGALWTSQGYFYGSLLQSVIESCEGWQGGNYITNPKTCAGNALSVLIPYFYTREWWQQNVDTPEAFQRWRTTWGEYYLDIQDARDLYYLSKSTGLGWVGDTPGFNGDVNAALGAIKAQTLFIYSPTDQFFLPEHIEAQVKAIPHARAVSIHSPAGHLICCNGDPQATHVMGEAIRRFLLELTGQRRSRE